MFKCNDTVLSESDCILSDHKLFSETRATTKIKQDLYSLAAIAVFSSL